jgi:hypothetical protein
MLGRRLLPALAVAGFFAVAGACSFPDVSYGTGDAGRATDAYVSPDGYVAPGDDTGTTGSDGPPGDDAASGVDGASSSGGDATPGTDGSTGSDSSANDGSSVKDAPPDPDVLNCDKDNDTFRAAGPPCNGNDCCDTDSNAHPGQGGYFTSEDNCHDWDYNCDKSTEEEWGMWGCSGLGLACTPTAGFIGSPPECGLSAPWSDDCGGAVTCGPNTTSSNPQACH